MVKNNNLARLREQQGMTQREVAEELHVSRPAVSQWERGEVMPSTENLLALSRLYSVPVEMLFQDGAVKKAEVMPESMPEETPPPCKHGPPSKRHCSRRTRLCVGLLAIVCMYALIYILGIVTHSRSMALGTIVFATALILLGWIIRVLYKTATAYKKEEIKNEKEHT